MSYRPRHAKQSPLKRRATTFAAGLGVAASLAAPAPAHAAPVQVPIAAPSLDAISQQANAMLADLDKTARNTAWDIRNSLRQQANSLAAIHPDLPAQAKTIIDNTVETFFPGLIAEKTPKPKPAPAPAPAAAAPAAQTSSTGNETDALYAKLRTAINNLGFQVPATVQDNYAANRNDYNAFYAANQPLVDAALAGDYAKVAQLVGANFSNQVNDTLASLQQSYLPR